MQSVYVFDTLQFVLVINMFLTCNLQVIILDVRVPCTPVARLNNHRSCVNSIAWAPHSSCHVCTAGMCFRARSHQASESTLRQCCDKFSDTTAIKNNGVTSKWVITLFWSNSIVFNESSITSTIAALMLTLHVNGH